MEDVRKDLMLSGNSVLAVEVKNNKVTFLTVTKDREAMEKTDYNTFMECFKDLAYTFATSWNKKLIEEYREFDSFVYDVMSNVDLEH